MGRSQTTSKSSRTAAPEATLAHVLAPEDVRRGDYVAVLYEVVEIPSWFWCNELALAPRDELVRIRCMPREEAAPLKVRGVCLPFVLVREPCGRDRTVDVRRLRLARLDRAYARAAWRSYRKACDKNGVRC